MMTKIYNVKNASVGLPVGWAKDNKRGIVEQAAEFAGRSGYTTISFDNEHDACVELTCHHNDIYGDKDKPTVYCDVWYAELAIVEDGKEIAWNVIKTARSTNDHRESIA